MNRVHLLLESDWSIVLIMTGAVKQIVEEGRILVTVHHIFSTNNGMQNLISALKTSQPNGFTVLYATHTDGRLRHLAYKSKTRRI